MVSLNDVLLAMSNIPVDDPIAEIWGRGLQGGYKIIEYTGTLPITINADGNALLDYRIYGAGEGVGEQTENLFDKNTITPNSFLKDNGEIGSTPLFSISDFIPVENGDYLIYNARSGYSGTYHCVYDENKNFVRSVVATISDPTITIGDNEKYIRISINSSNDTLNRLNVCMVVKGTTAPKSYEPYGYKLPMTVSDGNTVQTVPVYIGENQLTENEYVSYGEQKIHKRTENLIPSPEPQTQTSNGVTAICDGNGVYTFTGTSTENAARFEFPIEEFTTPNLSDTNFIISFFNTKGLSAEDIISIGGSLYINPANRVIKNPSSVSNKKVNKISFLFQPNRETNFTISPMLVLGTVAPSQFVPHIAPQTAPVPFPEIPTIKGETVIDYDGTPKPSQMYVKYKDKG